MSHLDLSINLDFLLHSKLQQIILQSYQIVFEFDNSIRVTVETGWEFFIKGSLIGRGNPQRQDGPITELQKLIGIEVTAIFPKSDGTLGLEFSNNCKLVLLPCHGYEAYNISGKDIYIVV